MSLRVAMTALLSLAAWLVDSLWLPFVFRKPTGATTATATAPPLLLVRPDQIGDAVLWLPSAVRITEAWRARGFRIVMVASAGHADWLYRTGLFDEVWPLRRRAFLLDPLYRIRFLNRVRRLRAAEVLHPVWSRELFTGDAIVRFSGAARRIGWTGDRSNTTRLEQWLGNRVYTELLTPPEPKGHELRRNEGLLDLLGIPATRLDRLPLPRAPLTAASLPERYYVLVPGARREIRRWPAANFAAVASRLHRATGLTGVICGGRGEAGLAAEIGAGTGAPLLDLTGRTSLEQLTGIIADAALVICNDTGAVHLAAAQGTPCVCILGGGHYGRFLPYPGSRLTDPRPPEVVSRVMPCFGCNWVCRYRWLSDACAPCIAGVSVDQVWDTVVRAIESENGGRTFP